MSCVVDIPGRIARRSPSSRPMPEKNLRHFNVFAGRQESPAKPRVRAAIFAGSF
jgi:hypothetical protein